MKKHYFARFENKNTEMWVLNCDDVLNILLPKIKRIGSRYFTKKDFELVRLLEEMNYKSWLNSFNVTV